MGIVVSGEMIGELKSLSSWEDNLEKKLAVTGILTRAFLANELPAPIVVGGTAVAVYTKGLYSTVDLDLISGNTEEVNEIMSAFGFKKAGKDYFHPEIDMYVEFPSRNLEGNLNMISEYIVDSTTDEIYIIGLEDIILDRVESFVSTNDLNSKEWAMRIMGGMYPHVDWSYLHKEAAERKVLSVLEKLQREVKRYKDLYLEMMND